MTLVALHAVKPAAVDRHDGTLNIDEIVLAQLLLNPFNQRLCHILKPFRKHIHSPLFARPSELATDNTDNMDN
jgi:hypothetical protein